MGGVVVNLNRPKTFWVTYESPSGGSARLELKRPRVDDRLRWGMRYRAFINEENPEATGGFMKDIATDWWVGFEGFLDQNGKPLENSPEMRLAILLESDLDLFTRIIDQLASATSKVEEGNAVATSG